MKPKTRLYIPDIHFSIGKEVILESKRSHYIASVLRLKCHDIIGLFNGKEGEFLGEIHALSKKAVTLHILEHRKPPLLPEKITLLFALIKKTPLDFLLQKATEIGCGAFQPLITEYTVIRHFNKERAEKIIIEAAEQCGLTALPEIYTPLSLHDLIEDNPYQKTLFCNEKETGVSLREIRKEDRVDSLLIGPEGGFSPTERDILQTKDSFHSISMGPRILRAETAAIMGLSCLVC